MQGLVRCKHEHWCSRTHREDVSFRDVKIKIPDRNWDQGMWWRHASEAWAEIWEKAVSWVPASERESRDSDLREARRICALRALHVGWVESWWCQSSQHRKIVCLSPHVEKPINSKRWCPWCNCYRRRKWTRWHEFKSWTRLIAFHIALIPLGKVWIQLFSLQLWINSRTN